MNDATPVHMADMPEHGEAAQRAYYDAVRACTLQAEAQAGAITRCYDVAGIVVRIVFAGPVLEAMLTPALAHLLVADTQADIAFPDVTFPDVTFHVWDSASTATAMPPPPCTQDCFTDRGDIWGMAGGRTRIAFHWSEYAVALAQQDLAECIYWVQEADSLPYWARASPLRTLFHWVMQWHGRHLLHAAAIGTADGAILITGRGGVGKSTTALCCLAAGMQYIGDDYLIVALDPEPTAISLYATAKLNPDQFDRFADLAEVLVNADQLRDEKAVLQLHPRFADQIARRLPLRAIVTPQITGARETGFGPVTSERLVHAASLTTMSQLPHAGRQSHDFIARLVSSLPNMTLLLGHDLAAIPAAIASQLRHPVIPAQPARPERTPSVSVIIPVHNGAGFLADAVASILRQGGDTPELIIVDDGSTDDIDAVVRGLPLEVRYFRQEHDGPSSARNRGIRNATGEIVAFLDVDDLWPEGRMAEMIGELQRSPELDLVQGHAQLFRRGPADADADVDASASADAEMEYLGSPTEAYPYYIGSAIYRSGAFAKVGLFDEELRFGEDTDWFKRAEEQRLAMRRLPIVTLLVRRHPRNMTRGKSMKDMKQLLVFKKLLDRQRQAAGQA